MEQKECVDWFIKRYGISEKEAEECYKVTLDMANFCISEYLKHKSSGGSDFKKIFDAIESSKK